MISPFGFVNKTGLYKKRRGHEILAGFAVITTQRLLAQNANVRGSPAIPSPVLIFGANNFISSLTRTLYYTVRALAIGGNIAVQFSTLTNPSSIITPNQPLQLRIPPIFALNEYWRFSSRIWHLVFYRNQFSSAK